MPQTSKSSINQSNRLATRWRTKYPGDYDDLTDDELESKIAAKYPGDYDDLIPSKVTTQIEQPGLLKRTWDRANTAPTGITDRTRINKDATILEQAGGM